jgi:ABC-type uncharacterized transport system substrate-binding protein
MMAATSAASVCLPAPLLAVPRRIGFLMYDDTPEARILVNTFRDALQRLGLREGNDLTIDYRWARISEPDEMQRAAKELIAFRPELIVSSSSPATAVLLNETRTVPIVFVQVFDPIAQGFVATQSRPAGNATGLANFEPAIGGKWLALLKSIVPGFARLTIPFNANSAPYAEMFIEHFRTLAPGFGVKPIAFSVASMSELDALCARESKNPGTAVLPMPSGFSTGHVKEIAEITLRHRLPSMYITRSYVQAGGLAAYGNSIKDQYKRAADFVDRILKGASPGELPVEFPVTLELALNLKTARSLDLTIPQTLLATADEVIE